MLEKIRSNPVLVTALVQAVLTLLVTFAVPLNPAQIAAILTVTGAVLALVARSKVTPLHKH